MKTFSLPHSTLVSIAEQFQTPTYVYHAQILEQTLKQLKSLFKEVPVEWLYAVKANDNPHLLSIIARHDFGFDTVSFEEALLGLHFVEPTQIFYTENNMTDEEMLGAIQEGVVLNIGSLSRLKRFIEEADEGSSCSIRIKPDIGDGHHSKVVTGDKDSKFGIRIDLIQEAVQLASKKKIRIEGLHAHIGSGIKEPKNIISTMKKMLSLCHLLPDLRRINFGGGFPIPYTPDEPEFDIYEFASLAENLLKAHLNDYPKVTYMFEPGRFVMAQCGCLLTRVNTVKNQGNVTFLGTDTGFNHLARPVMYDAYHHIINCSSKEKDTATYTVAGNICESGDIIGSDRNLPQTKEGDVLAILDAGAYGMTMASPYNRRALPAEVLINQDQCIEIRPRVDARTTVREFLSLTKFE